MTDVLKDSAGIVYKYPNRTCNNCVRYPCFDGIKNLSCDFAKYGCRQYTD